MQTPMCEQKDGYLGHWLAAHERIEFEAHLADCPECRQFVQEQRRLDGLLARANDALLPVPGGLVDRIEQRLRKARRRRLAASLTGLAAAAVLVCSFAAWLLAHRSAEDGLARFPLVEIPPQPLTQLRDPRSLVEVTFLPPSEVIAVPQKTENPSVTIIWVYPTIKTALGPKAAPSDLPQTSQRSGI